eukprot:2552192-Pleurochrysis_carterae.AAC.2
MINPSTSHARASDTGSNTTTHPKYPPKGRQEREDIQSNCIFWYGSGRCLLPLPPSKPLVRMGGGAKGPVPSGTDLRVSEPRDEQAPRAD